MEEGEYNRCHWISPTRNIEFKRWGLALEFEKLRKKFGNDEVQAWKEYRRIKVGSDVCVVSPNQHDDDAGPAAEDRPTRKTVGSTNETSTHIRKDPPGPGWTYNIRSNSGGINRCHWISPTRKIEFKWRGAAVEFENLRLQFGTDEVRAWHEYSKIKDYTRSVVSPGQYDDGANLIVTVETV